MTIAMSVSLWSVLGSRCVPPPLVAAGLMDGRSFVITTTILVCLAILIAAWRSVRFVRRDRTGLVEKLRLLTRSVAAARSAGELAQNGERATGS